MAANATPVKPGKITVGPIVETPESAKPTNSAFITPPSKFSIAATNPQMLSPPWAPAGSKSEGYEQTVYPNVKEVPLSPVVAAARAAATEYPKVGAPHTPVNNKLGLLFGKLGSLPGEQTPPKLPGKGGRRRGKKSHKKHHGKKSHKKHRKTRRRVRFDRI